MDEKLIDQLYSRASSLGYKKSRDEFASLVKTDNEVFDDMFSFAQSKGLVSDENQFGSMVGKFQAPYKKKDESTMVGLPEQIMQTAPQAKPEPQLRVSETPVPKGEQRLQAVQRAATELPSADGLSVSAGIEQPLKPSVGIVSESTAVPKVDVTAIQKQKEFGDRESYWDNILNNINLGANSFDKMVASIPETAINILATPGNAIAYLTGLDIATNADKIKEQFGIRNPVLDWLNDEQKVVQEKVAKFNKENYSTSGVAENISNGNYGDAFELIGSGIAQSIPVSLAMMYGGAMLTPMQLVGAGTVGFYGENAKELGEEDPNMPEIEKTLKALGMSSAETVFSAIGTGTIGQVYRDLVKKEGADVAKNVLQSGLAQSYKKAIEKYGVPVGLVGEGIEEAATQITQNVISGKPAFQGAADAFIIGAGSGAAFTAPISGAKAVNYISDKIQIYDTKNKIESLVKEKGTTLDKLFNVPVANDITVDQVEIANMGKSRDLLLKDLEVKMKSGDITEDDAKQSLYVFDKVQQVSNAVKDLDVSAEDKATIASLLKKRDDIKVKMQNKDDVLLGREKQQVADINNQINEIILKPKEDAVQEQAAGQVPVQPTTGVSQQMAQGEPQAGPEVAAEEGVQEVVTPKEAIRIYPELKDTKATDDTGVPLLVYHGGIKFDDFNPSQTKEDKGIYFTDNKDFALYFAHQAELAERDKRGDDYSDIPEELLKTGEPFPEKYFKYAKVHKAYLDMKNPTIVDAIDAKAIPKNYEPNTDGFIAKSTGDFGYKGGQYVVFDSRQIKKVPEVAAKEGVTTKEQVSEEEVVPSKIQVAVAPFFNTKIKSVEEASVLRQNKSYQDFVQQLIDLGNFLGIRATVNGIVGGYESDAGDKIVEISAMVSLENATIDQAEEYAAISAAIAPEVQEASIAIREVDENDEAYNANKYEIKVSDVNKAVDGLKDAGIFNYSIDDANGIVSFIDVLDFSDLELQDKIGKFVRFLKTNNVSYEQSQYQPVESRYVDKGRRQEVLRRTQSQRATDQPGQKGIRDAIERAIARDAEFQGKTIEEYTGAKRKQPAAGNRLFNQPIKEVAEIANRYYQRAFGTKRPNFKGTRKLDKERAKRISDAFDAMKHSPNDPDVREAYNAMAKETIEQYKEFLDAGYVVEINNQEPYANSQEMIDDLRNNKRIKIFSTESGFGDTPITEKQRKENPLLGTTEFTDVNGQPMLVNDLFRAVHDFFGHAELGNSFGAKGEENAWNVHARMFSPLARRAMTTETRGQNSYVNFSGVNNEADKVREESRKLREEGKLEEALKLTDEIYQKTSFADQKVGLLPEEFSEIDENDLGDIDLVQGKAETTTKEQLGVPSSDTAGISAIESRSQEDARKKAVIEAVKKVVNTLKSVFPNAEIYIHETKEGYSAISGNNSRGVFSYTRAKDGSYSGIRIDINLSNADVSTVYHEVAHAIMLKAFGENPYTFKKFRNQIASILSESTVKGLNQFADRYKNNTNHEEWLVELSAQMSKYEKQIPQTLVEKIAAIVNKIVSDITNGAFKPFSETTSRKELVDFLNQMSSSIRKGERVSIESAKITPAEAGAVAKEQIGKPISELPGYDKLMRDVTDTLIPNAIKRKMTGQEMIDLVKRFVSRSDIYKKADDIQRDELVRQVNGMLGEAYKNAPSAQKLLGLIQNPTKVTMNEKTALKKQIMDIAKGAKDAKKAWMKATDELTKSIKDMVRGGKISIKQAAAVLRRFSGVNMFSEDSISKFVDYMGKVFADAEYADRIATIRKSLKQAKKNIESKIGISAELKPLLRQMLAINPNLIPDSVLDTYAELVQMFGERKAVLSLQDVRDVTRSTSQVLEAIRQQESLVFELKEMFDQFDQKVLDDDGKVLFSDTVTAMVDLGLITSAEADVMKKYKTEIFPREEAVPKTEAELKQEKDSLISSISGMSIYSDTLPSREERDASRKLSELIKDESALDKLSINDLQNLSRVIDLINNGYFPHIAEVMVEKLDAAQRSAPILESLDKANPLTLSQFVAKVKNLVAGGKRGVAATMIERLPLFYLDQVFGDFKSSALYNNIIKPISVAQAKFKKDYNDIQSKLNRAFAKVSSSFKDNPNKVTKSKFKMMTYLLELEYRSNPGSKSVASAMSFINKTAKAIQGGNTRYSDLDAEMLQEIANDFADGTGNEIDIDALYDSFNAAEVNAISTIQEINKSLADKAAYTANVIRGQKFVPVENYIHHSVIFTGSPMDDLANTSLVQAYNNSVSGSTRAKSLIERTDGAKPIDFDVASVVNYSAKGQLMDYYLTAPIRTARRTMNLVEKEMSSFPSEKRKLFQGVNKSFERSVDNFLIDTIAESTLFDKFTELVSRQGYRAVLASVPRFISELTSNFSYVLAAGKKDFAAGVGIRDIVMSSAASSIMKNLGSQQTNRVYSGDTLSGSMIDPSIMKQTMGTTGSKVKGDLANATAQIYNKLIKKPVKNPVELIADTLISTPDKLIMRPLWFGSFRNEFKKITGSEPDFQKIEANDEAYMNDNKEALDQATSKADQTSVFAGATDNPFMGILKGTTTRDSTVTAKVYNNFNSFMTRFLIYEYMTARTAVYALAGNGQISKDQAVGLLAGVTSRMVVYSLLTSVLGNAMLGAVLGDDDEEDEKSFGQKVGQATTSAFTSMFIGRDFGNAVKSIANIGVEKINEKYLDFLRNGDYDPYKDAIQYTVAPTGEQSKATDLGNLIAGLSGSFGPALKTANLIVKKMTEPEKKQAEARERRDKEIGVRIPLEVLGNLGFVPLYKDIRKIVLADIYKDMGKKSSGSKTKEAIEKFLLQGYMNRTDMQRYDPELYKETFGDGGLKSMLMPDEEIKSEIKKEMDRTMRSMKDEVYDYIPKDQKKKSLFGGGEEFGKEGKSKKKETFGGGEFGGGSFNK